jgi:phasin family protein
MTVDPKTLFADLNDRTKAAMEKSAKTVEELNDFAKGNVEAIVESSKITAKGLEALSQEAVEYGRKSFETATAALKSMAAAKSPTDFFKLQSDFFRGAFDSYVAEASKTTEAVIKLAGEAAQPISSRVALAAEKAKIAA